MGDLAGILYMDGSIESFFMGSVRPVPRGGFLEGGPLRKRPPSRIAVRCCISCKKRNICFHIIAYYLLFCNAEYQAVSSGDTALIIKEVSGIHGRGIIIVEAAPNPPKED